MTRSYALCHLLSVPRKNGSHKTTILSFTSKIAYVQFRLLSTEFNRISLNNDESVAEKRKPRTRSSNNKPQSAEYSELPGTLRRYPGAHQTVTCGTTEQGPDTKCIISDVSRGFSLNGHACLCVRVCVYTVVELRRTYVHCYSSRLTRPDSHLWNSHPPPASRRSLWVTDTTARSHVMTHVSASKGIMGLHRIIGERGTYLTELIDIWKIYLLLHFVIWEIRRFKWNWKVTEIF